MSIMSGQTSISESIELRYDNSEAAIVTANIRKDGVIVGFFNASPDGVTGFSLQRGHRLTDDEVKLVFQAAIDDTRQWFQPGNEIVES